MNLKNFLIITRILKILIRFLFPNHCQNCGKLLNEKDKNCFCSDCWGTIKIIKDDYCTKCGKPIITARGICQKCSCIKFYYKQIRVVGVYENILKNAIHLYKYSFRWKISRDFTRLIENNISKDYIKDNDYIIPVPVSPSELIKKGFPHTLLIAKMISKKYGLPIIKDLVIKHKKTIPQSKLKRAERLVNLNNAFRVRKKYWPLIINKNILLFDDVYTTGATVREISRELSRYKVKRINVLALARGL